MLNVHNQLTKGDELLHIVIIIIIIRTLGRRRPIAPISFAGNVHVRLQGHILADGGCGALYNGVESRQTSSSGPPSPSPFDSGTETIRT